jgi:hypothetical protein
MQKTLKLTLKSVVVLLIALFVSLLLLLWRLSSSPIQLNQFVPRIEQAASNLPGGLSVRLKGIGLFWNRSEWHIDLRALDVELVESAGSSLVSVPEVNVSLSVFALLHGVFALSSIELNDIDVQLVRREDGAYQIFKNAPVEPGAVSETRPRDYSETFWHLFKTLASDADPQKPLSYLKNLKIKGALEIEDRKTGLNWAADTVESLFVGHRGQVNGDLGVTFSSPQVLKGIHTDIALSLMGDAVTASLAFEGVRPAGFATLDQRLAVLAGLDMSFSGTINTALTLPDKVQSLAADIRGGAGRLSYRDFYPVPLEVNTLALKLSANLPDKSLQVSSLDVLFGEAASPLKLHLSGTAKMLENRVAVKIKTGLQQLKVNEFDLYWPQAVAPGARTWLVDNLKAGTVNNAALDLAMEIPTGPEAKFRLGELKGNVAYSDLTVAYFGSLPPATEVAGSGTFNRRGFDLDINKGRVNGVNIESGKVIISGMDNKKTAISVSTHLNGPLSKVFAVLEAPPIKLNADSVTGLVSEQLGGLIEADFNIALPLQSGLSDGDIHYQANGKVTGGTFRKFYRDYDLQAANIDFDLDPSKIHFSGPLAFSGIPLVLDWTTLLAGPDEGHADFTIDSPNITGAQISALGYDVNEYLQGDFALKATAKLAPGGPITGSIATDLNNASLTIPKIHWSKPAGDGGHIGFTLLLEKNHLHAKDIDIELGKVKTRGNAEFDITGPIMSLTLENLALTYAQLKNLKLQLDEGKNLQISVQGGEANLAPILAGRSGVIDPQEKQVAAETKAIAEQLESRGFSLEVGNSKLDRVYINKDTFFDNVQFSGRRDSAGWQEISLAGHNPYAGSTVDTSAQPAATQKLASGQFRVVYGPSENGRYPLQIEAQDLGSLISAAKGGDVMKGGYLLLDGESQGPLLSKPISASFNVESFTVKEAPAIAKVLNMASLTQIISTFMQTGLAFNSASGDLQLDGTRLSSKLVRMRGGSLGLSVSGWADLKQKDLALNGTIIPLSKINNIVGKIPLLGQVVVGPDGSGIMSVDYTVTGTVSQPEASIRKAPLTRGVLKDTLGEEVEATTVPDTQ